jgi:hypothetical protein
MSHQATALRYFHTNASSSLLLSICAVPYILFERRWNRVPPLLKSGRVSGIWVTHVTAHTLLILCLGLATCSWAHRKAAGLDTREVEPAERPLERLGKEDELGDASRKQMYHGIQYPVHHYTVSQKASVLESLRVASCGLCCSDTGHSGGMLAIGPVDFPILESAL